MSTENRLLPVPGDFAFAWDDPDDATLTWRQESTHCPEPVSALASDFWAAVFRAISRMQEDRGSPQRMEFRVINTYLYVADRPVVPAEEADAIRERIKAEARSRIPRLRTHWEEEVLPEVKAFLDRWDAFDLDGATPDLLRSHLQDSWRWLDRLWDLHFNLEIFQPQQALEDLLKELFEPEDGEGEKPDPFQRLALTQGFPCKTTEMGQALWSLAQGATDGVRSLLASADAAHAAGALAETEGGPEFLAALSNFLEAYGHRGNHWGIQYPTWIENPAPVLDIVQTYLSRNEDDPSRRFEAQQREREEAVTRVRDQLQGYPEMVRREFDELLGYAQYAAALKEDHNFWIDFSATSRVRRAVLAAGRMLTETGTLESAGDVLHLHLDEILAALGDAAGGDLREVVRTRRDRIAHYARITPPALLGTEPTEDDKEDEAKEKAGAEAAEDEGVLRGGRGAPGVARGRVRIVAVPSAARHIEPGDILVTVSTSPSFAPLFATVGAIVTEAGGLLSHCAIVAREYRIPAVVGLSGARSRLKEGQLVEVDGTEGVVRLL